MAEQLTGTKVAEPFDEPKDRWKDLSESKKETDRNGAAAVQALGRVMDELWAIRNDLLMGQFNTVQHKLDITIPDEIEVILALVKHATPSLG